MKTLENQRHAGEAASRNTRRRLSIAVIALAGFTLAAAALALYVQRNIFEPARFADHAQTALGSPAVRSVAAEQLTEQLIDQIDPDLIAVRPVLDAASAALIDTTAFKRLFRSAVLQTHRAVIEQDLDSAALVLANVGVLVSESLRKLSPDVARQVPEGFDARLTQLAENSWESDVAAIAARTDRLAWVLPLVALLLFAGGVAVAPDRRKALSQCGLAAAGAGAGLIAAYSFTHSLAIHHVASGVDRDAADDIWHELMGGALYMAVAIATAGSALAAAAAGNLRSTDVDARARDLITRALRPPQTAPRRVLWSMALIAVGSWTLIDSLAALKGVTFLAGFYLVFRGGNELITLSMPQQSRDQEKTDAQPTNFARRFGAFAAAMALVFVAAAAIGAALIGEEGLQRLGVISDTRSCNGAESLCEKRFNEVTFAATHNSMSDKTYAGGWFFPEQDGPISAQLASGIRGLMLDVYYGYPGTRVYTDGDRSSPSVRNALKEEFGEEFVAAADRIRRTISKPSDAKRRMYLCHGFCELGALPIEEAFGQIRDFLDDNPREVLVIVFQDYVPTKALADEIEKSGVSEQVYVGKAGKPWPTLGQMIDDGRRVLMLNENNVSPAVPWIHDAYSVMQETPFSFSDKSKLAAKNSCRANRGEAKHSIFLLNHWIDTAPAPRISNARKANSREFLLERVHQCEQIRDRRVNLIAVDFFGQGDLPKVVDELNDVR